MRQKEAQQRAEEGERRRFLLTEAKSWRKATLIREYVAHIEQKLGPIDAEVQPELAGWLIWAEQVAEEMDPTTKWIDARDGSEC